MHIFKKIKGSNAQHTTEYIVLLTLIMAGIIITGPYVIRSWNANLKGWDDSIQDSLQEEYLQIPAADIPMTGCDPDPAWVDQGCFLGITDSCTGDIISCAQQEMLSTLTYSPPGCQCSIVPPVTWIACTIDPCCCTIPVSTSRCGVNADFVTGLRVPTVAACPGPPVYAPNMTNKYADFSCPDGMVEAYSYCGNDDDTDPTQRRYGCIPDPLCVFTCTPFALGGFGYIGLCAGSNTRLPSDVVYTYSDICSGARCEILCDQSVDYYSF